MNFIFPIYQYDSDPVSGNFTNLVLIPLKMEVGS